MNAKYLKIYAIALILALYSSICYAALDADTVWEYDTAGSNDNGGGFVWDDIVIAASYDWTASGSGTNEYYLQANGGGDPSVAGQTGMAVTTDGTFNLDTEGTAGSLNAGEWDWADNDTLGYSTVYVRLDDGADPDIKGEYFVSMGKGGGYDYSQQAASQLSVTDGATSGAGVTTFTSATGGFTALMVGNVLYLRSGTNATVGWYEITAYTDTNTVTLDRAPDDTVGGVSNGTCEVGGSRALMGDTHYENMVAGNLTYVKAGTYNLGSISVAKDGTATDLITVTGYNTTRGDNPTGTDRPLLACGGNNHWFDNYWHVNNFRVTITSSSGFRNDLGCYVTNTYVNNASGSASRSAHYSGSSTSWLKCEGEAVNGFAFRCQNSGVTFCYAHDSVQGLAATNGGSASWTVVDTCTTAILWSGADGGSITNCVLYNGTTGISCADSNRTTIYNNIIDSFTTGVIWTTKVNQRYFDYNCYNNNTTDITGKTPGDNDVFADPLFTNAAGGDFTLGSGSPCIDAGLTVTTDEGVTGSYKMNIGVDQDDVTAAGGGGGIGFFFVD